jgi:hypothetical protein
MKQAKISCYAFSAISLIVRGGAVAIGKWRTSLNLSVIRELWFFHSQDTFSVFDLDQLKRERENFLSFESGYFRNGDFCILLIIDTCSVFVINN